MRRFDKIKNIRNANILAEQRYLESKGVIIEELLTEVDIYPYRFDNYTKNISDRFISTFNADGLKYSVVIENNPEKSGFGEFEVSFNVAGQKHTSERQGRDLKHLNSVLYTVLEITEETVKRYKIQKIKFEGAGDAKDTDMFDTVRSRLYNRLVSNRYPSDAITNFGRNTYIDMSKVFPNEISSKNVKLDNLVDLLLMISDKKPDKESIMENVSGLNDDYFTITTDSVVNSELGGIYFDINVTTLSSEYDISYNIYDIDEEESEYFNTFKGLYNFIKNRFINSERNGGNDEPELDNSKEIGEKIMQVLTKKGKIMSYNTSTEGTLLADDKLDFFISAYINPQQEPNLIISLEIIVYSNDNISLTWTYIDKNNIESSNEGFKELTFTNLNQLIQAIEKL